MALTTRGSTIVAQMPPSLWPSVEIGLPRRKGDSTDNDKQPSRKRNLLQPRGEKHVTEYAHCLSQAAVFSFVEAIRNRSSHPVVIVVLSRFLCHTSAQTPNSSTASIDRLASNHWAVGDWWIRMVRRICTCRTTMPWLGPHCWYEC